MQRADFARSFVEHPYWAVMSRMLSGTIAAETERMLESDDGLAMSRASVGMCRKILKAPYFDIEQGKAAEVAYQAAIARSKVARSESAEREGRWKTGT